MTEAAIGHCKKLGAQISDWDATTCTQRLVHHRENQLIPETATQRTWGAAMLHMKELRVRVALVTGSQHDSHRRTLCRSAIPYCWLSGQIIVRTNNVARRFCCQARTWFFPVSSFCHADHALCPFVFSGLHENSLLHCHCLSTSCYIIYILFANVCDD